MRFGFLLLSIAATATERERAPGALTLEETVEYVLAPAYLADGAAE